MRDETQIEGEFIPAEYLLATIEIEIDTRLEYAVKNQLDPGGVAADVCSAVSRTNSYFE